MAALVCIGMLEGESRSEQSLRQLSPLPDDHNGNADRQPQREPLAGA